MSNILPKLKTHKKIIKVSFRNFRDSPKSFSSYSHNRIICSPILRERAQTAVNQSNHRTQSTVLSPILRELHDSALIELGDEYITPVQLTESTHKSVHAWREGLHMEAECMTYLHSKPLPTRYSYFFKYPFVSFADE